MVVVKRKGAPVANIPILVNDKVEYITWKELGARLWPFGKWKAIYQHCLDGEKPSNPVSKVMAVNAYHAFKDLDYVKTIAIEKCGGKFDGVRYKPSKPKLKDEN